MSDWLDALNWPKGLTKLIKATVVNGTSSLYEPLGYSRLEAAKTQAERIRQLSLAQTERDVQDIREGKLTYQDKLTKSLIAQPPSTAVNPIKSKREEPYINFDAIEPLYRQEIANKQLSQQINATECLKHAEHEIVKEPDENVSDGSVDPDWFTHWYESAEKVSNDDVRALWGKVLAGEIVKSGSYSRRTLNVLNHLSRDESVIFEKLASLITGDFCFRDIVIAHYGELIPHYDLMLLEEAGLVDDVGSNSRIITLNSYSADSYVKYITTKDTVFILRHSDPCFNLTVPIIKLTTAGQQLLDLAYTHFNADYFPHCAAYFKARGCTVHRATIISKDERNTSFGNEQEM